MHRAIFLAAATLVFGAIAVPGGSSSSSSPVRAQADHIAKADHITTRLRYKNGPWVTKLSLKLNKYKLNAFRVCGVFNWPAARRFTCLGAGSQLPRGATIRIEQSPIEKALRRADSPGWGMVGLAATPLVKVVLSNTETGNHPGTFYYRVSLRDVAGKIMLTSNKVQLVWHK